MNRKLIRTTLAEVKGRNDSAPPHHRERTGGSGGAPSGRGGAPSSHRGGSGGPPPSSSSGSGPSSSSGMGGAGLSGRKRIPPSETNAEIFYYKKQMDAHTQMVIVLLDGEEVEGTIEWYDRNALKINRRDAPNIMLLKHNIKYMYKAEDRDSEDGGESEG